MGYEDAITIVWMGVLINWRWYLKAVYTCL